jgi:hypothetical protein
VTRRGALVRSEAVDRLSPAGWEALRTHGVRTAFMERFPDRIEGVLDAIEQAPPGGVLFHCTELVASLDYDRPALRARLVV